MAEPTTRLRHTRLARPVIATLALAAGLAAPAAAFASSSAAAATPAQPVAGPAPAAARSPPSAVAPAPAPPLTELDLARFERPATQAAAVEYAQRLQADLERHPKDSRRWLLLARLRHYAEDYAGAVAAYDRALALSQRLGRDPQVLTELADAVAFRDGGKLQGRPRAIAERALAIDARNARALDLLGSAAYEAGEYRKAIGYWERLLAITPMWSPDRAKLVDMVDEARARSRKR